MLDLSRYAKIVPPGARWGAELEKLLGNMDLSFSHVQPGADREFFHRFPTPSRAQVREKILGRFVGCDDQLDKDQRLDPSAIRSRRSALLPSGRQKAASSPTAGG